jgi:uncharacterized delta-60 repeat protein
MKNFFTLILLLLFHFAFSQVVTRDNTFNGNNTTSQYGDIRSMAIQNDGKIIIVGNYYAYNGTSSWLINRLNPDGTRDASFHTPSIEGGGYPNAVAIQPWDNKIIIGGGDFTKVDGASRNCIARLNADGSLDATFNPGAGISPGYGGCQVYKILFKDDPDPLKRKILVGGRFGYYDNYNVGDYGGLIQLNTDGTRDASFDPQLSTSGQSIGGVYDMCFDRFGKLVVVGEFWQLGKTPIIERTRITRFNADGTLDTGFYSYNENDVHNWGVDSTITTVAVDNHDNILIGGNFTQVVIQSDTFPSHCMARLHYDGTLDLGFNANMGTGLGYGLFNSNANGGREAKGFYVMDDNTIIVVGNFSSFNGSPCNNIISVNDDGSLGPYTFGTSSYPGLNNAVSQILKQTVDGKDKILVGGFFNSYDSQIQGSAIRLIVSKPWPLPVDLTYAAASLKNNDVTLYWKIAMPQSTDRFQILKSADGRSFNMIQEMNEPNTLSEGDKYHYKDKNVSGWHIYYIIKVRHADGKESYSRTLSVDIKNSNFKVQAYSDPASHTFHITTQSDKPVSEEVRIFTFGGQMLKKTTLSVAAGSSENILGEDFTGFGKYVLLSVVIKETGQVYSFKLLQ